jgi:hypothetical protein
VTGTSGTNPDNPIALVSEDPNNTITYEWNIPNITLPGACAYIYLGSSNTQTSYSIYRDVTTFPVNAVTGTFTANWDGDLLTPGGRWWPAYIGTYNHCQISIQGNTSYFSVEVVKNTWDTDGDGISDAVEEENSGSYDMGPQTTITYNGNTYTYDPNDANQPPLIPLTTPSTDSLYSHIGTCDYTLAVGAVNNGRLSNGLRIPDQGTGYGDCSDTSPLDIHNWGTYELIHLIEKVGRAWNKKYPSNRIGVTSISLQSGGYFYPHTQHQNGLEADVLYVSTDDTYNTTIWVNGLNGVIGAASSDYDQARSQELINLFCSLGDVYEVLVGSGSGITGTLVHTDNSGTIQKPDHWTHFHVWLYNPD